MSQQQKAQIQYFQIPQRLPKQQAKLTKAHLSKSKNRNQFNPRASPASLIPTLDHFRTNIANDDADQVEQEKNQQLNKLQHFLRRDSKIDGKILTQLNSSTIINAYDNKSHNKQESKSRYSQAKSKFLQYDSKMLNQPYQSHQLLKNARTAHHIARTSGKIQAQESYNESNAAAICTSTQSLFGADHDLCDGSEADLKEFIEMQVQSQGRQEPKMLPNSLQMKQKIHAQSKLNQSRTEAQTLEHDSCTQLKLKVNPSGQLSKLPSIYSSFDQQNRPKKSPVVYKVRVSPFLTRKHHDTIDETQQKYKRMYSDSSSLGRSKQSTKYLSSKKNLELANQSSINQDLEEIQCDKKIEKNRKSQFNNSQSHTENEPKKQKVEENINKLLRMTEERVVKELQFRRRSQSDLIETKIQDTSDNICQKGNVVKIIQREKKFPPNPPGINDSLTDIGQKNNRTIQEQQEYKKQQSFSFSHAKSGKIIQKSADMGPFYQKYINQMNHSFVKDRVRRLKETFDAVRTGKLENQILIQGSNLESETKDNKNQNQSGQFEQQLLASQSNNVQSSTGEALNHSVMMNSTFESELLQKSEQIALRQKRKSHACVMRKFKNERSPLMCLSGIELKYRLGQGDLTLDQVLQTNDKKLGQNEPLGKIKNSSNDTNIKIKSDSCKFHDRKPSKQNLCVHLPDTAKNKQDVLSSFNHRFQSREASANCGCQRIGLPALMNKKFNHTCYEKQEQKRLSSSSTLQHQSSAEAPQLLSAGSFDKKIDDEKISDKFNIKNCHSTFNFNNGDQIRSMNDLKNQTIFSSIITNKGPTNIKDTKKNLFKEVKDMNQDKDFNDNATQETPFGYKSLQNLKTHFGQQKQKAYENTASQKFLYNKKLKKQKLRRSSIQTGSAQQLIDETIRHMYNDINLPKTQKHPSQIAQGNPHQIPMDLAVLKLKAFQQFDLIRDAEKDLERQIKTQHQIKFAREATTPRERQKFRYSTMSSKLNVALEDKSLPEDQSKKIYQPQDSQINSSSLIVNKNTIIQDSKPNYPERKLCNSCIAPSRAQKAYIDANETRTNQFRSTKRTFMSNEEKLSADMMNGSYHTRLHLNLKIMQDYQLAAGRTRHDYNLEGESSTPEGEIYLQEPVGDNFQKKESQAAAFEKEVLEIAERLKLEETVSNSSRRSSELINKQQQTSDDLQEIIVVLNSMQGNQRHLNSSHLNKKKVLDFNDETIEKRKFLPSSQFKVEKDDFGLIKTGKSRYIEIMNSADLAENPKLSCESNLGVFRTEDEHQFNIITNEIAAKNQDGQNSTGSPEIQGSIAISNQSEDLRGESSPCFVMSELLLQNQNEKLIPPTAAEDGAQSFNSLCEVAELSASDIQQKLLKQSEEVSNKLRTQSSIQADDQPAKAVSAIGEALTKSSQRSISEQAWQQPIYSIGLAQQTRKLNQKGRQNEMNQKQGKNLEKKDSMNLKLPSVRNQMNIRQANVNCQTKSLADIYQGTGTTKTPKKMKIRDQRAQRRTPAIVLEDKQQISTLHKIAASQSDMIKKEGSGEYNMLIIAQAESVIDDSSAGDVATLAKSSVDSASQIDISQIKNNSCKATLQVRMNSQVKAKESLVRSGKHKDKKAMLPKRQSQPPIASRWKSPFQIHLEALQAQKKMLQQGATKQLPAQNSQYSEDEEEKITQSREYLRLISQPQAVYWYDSGKPAPGSLVQNLDPWDIKSDSQAPADSHYSMTLVQGKKPNAAVQDTPPNAVSSNAAQSQSPQVQNNDNAASIVIHPTRNTQIDTSIETEKNIVSILC